MRAVLRAGLTVALVVAAAASLGACAGKAVSGTPLAVGNLDTTSAGGLEVTDGPSGPRDGVEDASLEVEGADGGEMDRLAINAIADLYEYWGEQLPKHFDQEFEPLQRLLSYDSGGAGVQICGASTADLVNAFYCGGGGEDAIAWDRGKLLPMLNEMFGPMSVVGVLAHEMGHAVQFRLGEKSNISQSTPTIVREQQADCYMGNFFRYVAEDRSAHFQINTGKGLNDILATLFFIRDPAGLDHRTQGAHGLAFDRVYAFQEGFTNPPTRCAEMDPEEIEGRIAERERSDNEMQSNANEGDIDPTAEEIQAYLRDSLNQAFEDNEAEQPEIVENGSTCENGEATAPVTYCPEENLVGYDADALREIAAKPDPAAPPGEEGEGGLGDFAAFAEIASRYALAIQKSVGLPLDDENAGLRTACLTGAWAGYTDEETEDRDLRLAIGDLDEAVAELLQDDSLVAADVNGKQVASGFARVEAFRRGYMEGPAPCTTDFA
ncbi:neutral zinc metallopeptidase [Actinophytocola xanthii]|uniref:Aminopeptidase n=1 Tax=Actinophytocola xanthii TaxID=1912961 RepID=A0A1Q8CWA0_9PSEU|nr:aminopeptidase [Actinophytocola xanthii]OLF18634.1 aminopeptidase [Actinophytocola xanthii]